MARILQATTADLAGDRGNSNLVVGLSKHGDLSTFDLAVVRCLPHFGQ